MKPFLTALMIISAQLTFGQNVVISGCIRNINSSDQKDFCLVAIQDGKRIDSTYTDKYGFYNLTLKPGAYDFVFRQKGFEPLTLKRLILYHSSSSLNFGLKLKYTLVVTPVVKNNSTKGTTIAYDSAISKPSSPGSTVDAEEISKKSTSLSYSYGTSDEESKSSVSRSKSVTKKGSGSGSGTSGRGFRALKCPDFGGDRDGISEDKYVSKVSVAKDDAKDDPPKMDDIKSKDIGLTSTPEIKAGQITAGHWKDLEHWDEWEETNKDNTISSYMKTWGFYPKQLQHLKLVHTDGQPARHIKAILKDGSGKALWTSVSDVNGNCYFWSGMFGDSKPMESYQLSLSAGQQSQELNIAVTKFNSSTPLTIQFDKNENKQIEIGFMVDATGSMGDEIKYLQAEFIDVISRIKRERPCSDIRTGSVFYKDYTDDYLTRVMPLSSNPSNTISFIGEQRANGGGDFPEAVEAALKSSIEELGWSNSESTKILFMILDAPPHSNNEEHKKMVRQYAQLASEKGIRLVPVTASGIDKSTEFLMKYLAITTNGEYIYITNDSKIGDSHIKPTGGESKVEYLNDLMVRTVLEYSAVECNKPIQVTKVDTFRVQVLTQHQIDSIKQNETNSEIIIEDDWYMRFFPNPANEFLLVQFSETVESLRITTLNGQDIYNNTTFGQNEINMNISSWSSGIYVIYAVRGGKTISGKLLIMH